MKRLTFFLFGLGLLISSANLSAQTSSKAEEATASLKESSFKVYGNCGMCKKRIETAAKAVPGVSSAVWNVEEKMLTVSYEDQAGALKKIKEKVAEVGHDTEEARSKSQVYDALPGCCHYERPKSN